VACDAEFPGAHLCHASEYVLSTALTPVPATGAWLDPSVTNDGVTTLSSAPSFGRYISSVNTCSHWTSATSSIVAPYIDTSGALFTNGACNAARALACCNGASKAEFAGFTSASLTGNLGGRTAGHITCDAEFPGAHMCHAAEYVRAASTSAAPAAGAWIDPSADTLGTTTLSGAPSFGRYISSVNTCSHWTSATSSIVGPYIDAGGAPFTNGACNVSRRIACCF
jgi:hypothetical protein